MALIKKVLFKKEKYSVKYHVVAIGTRMPSWVNDGFTEYAKRLPKETPLLLHEIPAVKRSKHIATDDWIRRESDKICQHLGKQTRMVLLDVRGELWSTEQLAQQLNQWQHDGDDIHFVIGGADGVDTRCQQRAHWQWSLSRLTLPHPLVRIVLAEQLYRATTILQQHPYHRG